jgi:hypothetical protein
MTGIRQLLMREASQRAGPIDTVRKTDAAMEERDISPDGRSVMNSMNCATRREGNSQRPNIQITETSDAVQEVTVVTLASILKFVFFFTACFAVALLLVGWYLGYFERIVMR